MKLAEASDVWLLPDNRAFRYGYGLFETMLVTDGCIHLWQYHHQRLFAGMATLCFETPRLFTAEWLEQEILRTVKKNKAERLCRVRLQVFAGSGGIFDKEAVKPEFLIECFAPEPETLMLNENGLVVGLATGVTKNTDSLANLKTSNALMYAIAGRQAIQQKWNDALVLNIYGRVVESCIANIFWVKNNIVYTPPLAEGCVAGVMRRYIMEQLPAHGFTVREQPLEVAALEGADEVFLSNAIKKMRWVKALGSKTYESDVCNALSRIVF